LFKFFVGKSNISISCIWKYEVQHNFKNTFGYISLYFNVILVIPLVVNSRTQQGPIQSQCLCRSLDAATVTIKDAPRCSSYRNACVLINHIRLHNSMTQRRLSTSVCVSEFIYRSYWPLHEVFVAQPMLLSTSMRHAACLRDAALYTALPLFLWLLSVKISDIILPHQMCLNVHTIVIEILK
jgi:hypothetical protein